MFEVVSDLVDPESYGPMFPILGLLCQGDDDTALRLGVPGVGVAQGEHEVGVGQEAACGYTADTHLTTLRL